MRNYTKEIFLLTTVMAKGVRPLPFSESLEFFSAKGKEFKEGTKKKRTLWYINVNRNKLRNRVRMLMLISSGSTEILHGGQ